MAPTGVRRMRAGELGSGLLPRAALACLLYGSPPLLQVTLGLGSHGQWLLVKKLGARTHPRATAGPCSGTHRKGSCPGGGVSAPWAWGSWPPRGLPGSGFTGRGGHLRTEGSGFFARGPFLDHCTTLPAPPGPQTAGECLFVPGSPPRLALTHPPCPKLVTHLCFLSLTRAD